MKGLDKATLVTSCDTYQDSAWFAEYLAACGYQAESRGLQVYAVDMEPAAVESFWAAFLGQGHRAYLRNRAAEVENATTKQLAIALDLQTAQAAFLRLPSASHYVEQERLSLRYQEVFQAAEEARQAIRSFFRDKAEETKRRLASQERDQRIGKMAQRVWARERVEREGQAG